MILHLINKISAISQCIDTLATDDAILLIEEATSTDAIEKLLAQINPSQNIALYALTAIQMAKTATPIKPIDNSAFVNLTCQAEKVVSWY